MYGVAIRTVPESCAAIREGRREALTGVRVGQPLSGEKTVWDAHALEMAEGKTDRRVIASAWCDPTSSETLRMHVRLLTGIWEVFALSTVSYGGTYREEPTRSR